MTLVQTNFPIKEVTPIVPANKYNTLIFCSIIGSVILIGSIYYYQEKVKKNPVNL